MRFRIAVIVAAAVVSAGCGPDTPAPPGPHAEVPAARPPAPPPAPPPAAPLDERVVARLDDDIKDDPHPLPQNPARAAALRAAVLAWARGTSADAFARVGETAAPWAAAARAALDARAKAVAAGYLSGFTDHAALADAEDALWTAADAGCRDPLVLYWVRRADVRAGRVNRLGTAARDRDVARGLWESNYPDLRKLHAVHNLLAALDEYGERHPAFPERAVWDERYWELFGRAALDRDPHTEADVMEIASYRGGMTRRGRTREQNHADIDRVLARAGAREYVRLVVQADFLKAHAWDARGTGTADTVTPEGGRLMAERLAAARKALERAWDLDPSGWQAPTLMIGVCLGLGLGRDEMETWFARAMRANPDNARACAAKLTYLSPKWYGTRDEYVRFAWQCVRTGNFDGFLPYAAADTFFTDEFTYLLARADTLDAARAFYHDDRVWAVVRRALEGHLVRRPDDRYFRSALARAACLAGKYDVARQEFAALGERYDTSIFPTWKDHDVFREEADRAAEAPRAGER